MENPLFKPVRACWICGASSFLPYHRLRMDLSIYKEQDPELARYRDITLQLQRCMQCGFGQPEALPTLPRFFDRMYDQHWSDDWIDNEFHCGSKDFIFRRILDSIQHRNPNRALRLLDVGAHVGRLLHLARQRGWTCEGIELNPKTRAYAEAATRLKVHHINAHSLAGTGARYDVITLIDVLEHIPEPSTVLKTLHALLDPQGMLVVKVPNGRAQRVKEEWKSKIVRGYTPTLADNLVHVNHFDPHSLELALQRAGFGSISIKQGAPEETAPIAGFRAFLRNKLGPSFLGFYLLECLPSRWVSPMYLHLEGYAGKAAGH